MGALLREWIRSLPLSQPPCGLWLRHILLADSQSARMRELTRIWEQKETKGTCPKREGAKAGEGRDTLSRVRKMSVHFSPGHYPMKMGNALVRHYPYFIYCETAR